MDDALRFAMRLTIDGIGVAISDPKRTESILI